MPEVQVKRKTVDRRNRDEDDDDEDEDEEQGSDTSGGEEDSDDDANSEDDGDDKEQEEHRPRVPSTSVAAIPTNTSVKRLRAKYATCTHCAAEYDVTDNRNDSCTWHPGKHPHPPLQTPPPGSQLTQTPQGPSSPTTAPTSGPTTTKRATAASATSRTRSPKASATAAATASASPEAAGSGRMWRGGARTSGRDADRNGRRAGFRCAHGLLSTP